MIKVVYYFMSHLETFDDFKGIKEVFNLHIQITEFIDRVYLFMREYLA